MCVLRANMYLTVLIPFWNTHHMWPMLWNYNLVSLSLCNLSCGGVTYIFDSTTQGYGSAIILILKYLTHYSVAQNAMVKWKILLFFTKQDNSTKILLNKSYLIEGTKMAKNVLKRINSSFLTKMGGNGPGQLKVFSLLSKVYSIFKTKSEIKILTDIVKTVSLWHFEMELKLSCCGACNNHQKNK